MATFYLHVRHDTRVTDHEGGDYADFDAARRDAVTAAREIMGERLRAGEALDGSAMKICDADGEVLETLRFRDLIRVDGR